MNKTTHHIVNRFLSKLQKQFIGKGIVFKKENGAESLYIYEKNVYVSWSILIPYTKTNFLRSILEIELLPAKVLMVSI